MDEYHERWKTFIQKEIKKGEERLARKQKELGVIPSDFA